MRLIQKVFHDLAIWMVTFGLAAERCLFFASSQHIHQDAALQNKRSDNSAAAQ